MKTKKTLNFKVRSLSGQADLQCTVDQLIMAGWVGRNREALQAHIDELAELGIPGPKNVPEFYPLSVDRLSQGASIQVSGKDTSGEVEFFLVRQGAETYVGLGSDQTDRALETNSITLSKQICDKVLCSTLWPFQEVQTHWDRLRLRAWIEEEGEEVLYQEGLLGEMLAPGELFEKRFDGELPEFRFCSAAPCRSSAESGLRRNSGWNYTIPNCREAWNMDTKSKSSTSRVDWE